MNYLTLSTGQKHADEQVLQDLVHSDQCVHPCLKICICPETCRFLQDREKSSQDDLQHQCQEDTLPS